MLLAEYGQVDDRTYEGGEEGNDDPLAGGDPAGSEPPRGDAAASASGRHTRREPSDGDPPPDTRAARLENELDLLWRCGLPTGTNER